MTDLLIGLAVLAGFSLFVYAVVRAGRRQRRERGALFRAFAAERDWEYCAQDDRGLRPLLETFEGIGSYRSASLGAVAPEHVVTGAVDQGRAWVFWHSRRVSEGDALQFTACLVTGRDFGNDSLIIRFGEERALSSGVAIYYSGERDRVQVGSQEILTFEAEPGSGRRRLAGDTARLLVEALGRLPWAVDLQIRRSALALYTVSRNLDLTTPDQLALLVEVTGEVADILATEPS